MNTGNSILQEITETSWRERRIRVFVKRDDLIHPQVSGNKWRKLKYAIAAALHANNNGILTFGGAYSNHLLATAAACHELGLRSCGIVRGDELYPDSNDTLRDCAALGMELRFVSREEYHLRDDRSYHEFWLREFPGFMIVPEGGASYLGMIGCQEIVSEIAQPFDEAWLALGTGTTACGVLISLHEDQQLHAVPVLKNFHVYETMRGLFMRSAMDEEWAREQIQRVHVHGDVHFGGYGKYTEELLTFIRSFYSRHGIPLDPVYTGKAMFALYQRLEDQGVHDRNIVFIHTGGIQGVRAIQRREGIDLFV